MASPSQPKSLIFDLEVPPGKAEQPDRIFMVGGLLSWGSFHDYVERMRVGPSLVGWAPDGASCRS